MAVKFNLNDYNINKKRRLHSSYSVSNHIDQFSLDEVFGHMIREDGTSTSCAISSKAYRVTNSALINKYLGKFNG